jgi:hypothetical protein
MNLQTEGPVDRWTGGPVDQQIAYQSSPEAC